MTHDAFTGKLVTIEESEHAHRLYESSVQALLCLETRKVYELKTANIVTAGAEGWIRLWTLNPQVGIDLV